MSGHKRATISISQEEYQRLLDVEVQQRAQTALPPPPPVEIVQQTCQAVDQNLQWMAERQNQFENMVSHYNGAIRDIERSFNASLFKQQQQMMGSMNRLAGSLWANTEQLLQQANQHYQRQIDQLQSHFVSQMDCIEQYLMERSALEDGRLAMAEQWLSAATALYGLIDQEYNHPFFLPGELERQGRVLMLAEKNLAAGLPEASIASAQQAYLGLDNARARLEKEEMDWLILRQSAFEAVQSVHAEISRLRKIHAIDLDGCPMNLLIDVDYWSKGQWQVLADEFLEVIEPLQTDVTPPTSAFLFELVNQALPDFRSRLADVCFMARIEALNSQLRANIADVVIQALCVQGFSVQDYAYEQSDWRGAFQTHLTGLDQSAVTVQVAPSGSEIGQNELHIYSLEQPLTSQRELHRRWLEVEEMLELSGLTVGNCQVAGSKRQETSVSLEQVRGRRYS